jgi:hypothetical protein
MQFAPEELARRVTDFQVAETSEGTLVGAVGLLVADRQGYIHSEAFTDFALADTLRPMLWNRLHTVANNFALLRFWTREQAPFWAQIGMVLPDGEAMEKLPAAWREPVSGLRTVKLRDDVDAIMAASQQFELLLAVEKERTRSLIQRAQTAKKIATAIGAGLAVFILAAAIYLALKNPFIFGGGRPQ